MRKIKKRLLPFFMAMIMLLGLLPTTAFAADVTMDLSKCEVSWDYILTDREGKPFSAAYGLHKKDNPFGYAITPRLRKMHDYTAKRLGLDGDKSKWIYGQDYVYCFCIEHGIPLPDDTTVTMAYVPFQQEPVLFDDTMTGLNAGTIFPELDKPFTGKGELK